MKVEQEKGLPLKVGDRDLPMIAHIGDELFGFFVYEEKREEYHVDFVVTEVVGVTESTPQTFEQEQYLTCYIKWDGCSHFYFGDVDDGKNEPSGYLHLCGARPIQAHCELMTALFHLAFKRMGRELPE